MIFFPARFCGYHHRGNSIIRHDVLFLMKTHIYVNIMCMVLVTYTVHCYTYYTRNIIFKSRKERRKKKPYLNFQVVCLFLYSFFPARYTYVRKICIYSLILLQFNFSPIFFFENTYLRILHCCRRNDIFDSAKFGFRAALKKKKKNR